MCEHFEQEVRSVKQLPWKMTSLYVIVHKIVFDMQHWTFYSRGPLSIDTMSNLVFIGQKGHIF